MSKLKLLIEYYKRLRKLKIIFDEANFSDITLIMKRFNTEESLINVLHHKLIKKSAKFICSMCRFLKLPIYPR